jgi:hypothetical protein
LSLQPSHLSVSQEVKYKKRNKKKNPLVHLVSSMHLVTGALGRVISYALRSWALSTHEMQKDFKEIMLAHNKYGKTCAKQSCKAN